MLQHFMDKTFQSYEDLYENFQVTIPESFNFAYDVSDRWAEKSPDKRALVWCNDKGDSRTFTFGEIKYYSDKAANVFKKLGIGKGDPVMLVLKRHYEFWFAILALHKIGAICIPATHLLTEKDYIYRNNAADVKLILAVGEDNVTAAIESSESASPSLLTKVILHGKRSGWINFQDELEMASKSFDRPENTKKVSKEDILFLYFTSGTTGYPKMVRHNLNYPLGHIMTAKYWHNVKEDGLHFTVADTGWAKSVWGKIYGQWLCGAAVMVYDYDKFVPVEMLAVIAKYQVNTFCAPPTVYRFLINEDFNQVDLTHLEYCTTAGEPLNPEVFNQFFKLTGLTLMEAYGQTELTVAIATFPWLTPKPGSMGKPSPGYCIELIDTEGNICEDGQTGQIVLNIKKSKPLGLFDGYYRNDEKTNQVLIDGWYYTGDTAWRDEDGYYWFVGRSDDIIKSSGYRIGPFEVESALLEHPGVLECAITGVSDALRGQIVKATVILSDSYQPGNDDLKKELQDHVKKVTAPYKYPRVIEFVKSLPKTISGKIRRVEIREQDSPQLPN